MGDGLVIRGAAANFPYWNGLTIRYRGPPRVAIFRQLSTPHGFNSEMPSVAKELLEGEGVNVTSIRAHVNHPIHHDRRRRYRVPYVITPQVAASARVQGVKLSVP